MQRQLGKWIQRVSTQSDTSHKSFLGLDSLTLYIDCSCGRRSKYNKKVFKYKVDVESESEDYNHDEEKEIHEEARDVTLLQVSCMCHMPMHRSYCEATTRTAAV